MPVNCMVMAEYGWVGLTYRPLLDAPNIYIYPNQALILPLWPKPRWLAAQFVPLSNMLVASGSRPADLLRNVQSLWLKLICSWL